MHKVIVTITNNAAGPLLYDHQWFNHGGTDQDFPTSIAPGAQAQVSCSGGILGTSGWVKYLYQGAAVFFCFSNPVTGRNGIELGGSPSAYDSMGGQYFPGNRAVAVGGPNWLTATIQSTGGGRE